MLFAKYNLFAKLLVNKEIVLGRYKGIFIHWEQYRYIDIYIREKQSSRCEE